MTSLRIVLVMPNAPLPFAGADARWFYVLIKGLVERGHRVTAFAVCTKENEIGPALDLFPAPQYDLRCFPVAPGGGLLQKWRTLRQPFSYLFSPAMIREVHAELHKGFDILHLEQLWSCWAVLPWHARALVNIHFLHHIDTEDDPITTWRGWAVRQLMLRGERHLTRRFQHFRALSDRLADRLRILNPKADVATIPIGLDVGLYSFIPDAARTTAPIVSVIGNMTWYPSVSAALRLLTRLWPEIQRRVPEVRLQIVGWEARRALKDYLDKPGITIEENVPDMRPYFERTSVLLYAPQRGSGMKIKILEALALGVPVVTTSEGIEGLPAKDGVHAGVSEEDEGLIDRTVALLSDPAAANRQRHQARALLEAHCGPGPTLDALEALYSTRTGLRA